MTGTTVQLRPGPSSSAGAAHGRQRVVTLVRTLLLFESAMYSALAPVLPHYARVLHAAKPAVGLLNASYPAGIVPGSLIAAWAASRLGVRRTTLLGLTVFAAAVAAFGLPGDIAVLDGLRFAQGIGCGFIWVAGLAWVIGFAERGRRGEMLGTVFAAAIFGTLLGPILGTLAVSVGTAVVFALVGAGAVGLAGWTWRHPEPPRGAEREHRPALRALLGDRRIALGAWLILLEAATIGAIGTLLPLRLSRLGGSGILIGATFLVAALASARISRPLGRMTDRAGPRAPLLMGLTATATLMVLLNLPSSPVLLALVTVVVLGGPLAAYTIPSMTILTEATEAVGISLVIASMVMNLAWAFGEALGAPAAATLAQAGGDVLPLLGLAALMVATLAPVALERTRLRAAASTDRVGRTQALRARPPDATSPMEEASGPATPARAAAGSAIETAAANCR